MKSMKLSHDRRMWCWHPQEGVFNGHFKPTEADKINRIGQLRQGVVKVMKTQSSPDVPENILLQT
jgi:hypothetical protein